MASSSEFYIFRDCRRRVSVAALVDRLRRMLSQHPDSDQLLSLLLCAGELECGISDASAPAVVCKQASHLTDLVAMAMVKEDLLRIRNYGLDVPAALELLSHLSHSDLVHTSVPEGFAYYALHPLDYADAVQRLHLDTPCVVVIGIRSIGTTLSAVVAARFAASSTAANRLTVRPVGHPYDRRCSLDAEQQQTIRRAVASGAGFLICDEGPGRSGSSLLSVGEALEREGVPASKISILCSHQPDPGSLCAPDASNRWSRYRSISTGATKRLPPDASEYLGGGDWRRQVMEPGQPWPAVWPQMERLRYGAQDSRVLWVFEGYGPYGAEVAVRNAILADAGFTPEYFGQELGFGKHTLTEVRTNGPSKPNEQLLSQISRYCAWRASNLPVGEGISPDLETMARANFEQEFESPLQGFNLEIECPAVCDAHMMPCEWQCSPSGHWVKLNAMIHGDDHFFPGPCDIAWDLAGVIVEWGLSASAREFLLSEYRNASGGDNVALRVSNYEIAYATFRLSWSRMAAASVTERAEQRRLRDDYHRYRSWIEQSRASQVINPSAVMLASCKTQQ